MRQRILPLLVLLPVLTLAACVSEFAGGSSFFTGSAGATTGKVDTAAAARMISEYRASRGLPPVKVDPTLTRIAQDQASRMAAADRLAHVLPGQGSFSKRLSDGGFQASLAAENIAAGQKSLSEALEAWRNSRGHNANLLKRGVSLIGIASAYTSNGPYKVYWSLVLAAPYEPPPEQTFPNAGPVVRSQPAGPGGFFGRIFGQ